MRFGDASGGLMMRVKSPPNSTGPKGAASMSSEAKENEIEVAKTEAAYTGYSHYADFYRRVKARYSNLRFSCQEDPVMPDATR